MKLKAIPSRILIILPVAVILAAGCKRIDQDLLNITLAVSEKYAPDPREGVFDVSPERRGRDKVLLRGEVDDPALKEILVDTLVSSGYRVTDSILVLPGELPRPRALVTLSTANIRSRPSHLAELVTQALMGTPVRVLKEERGWVFIQTPDRYLGWCEKASLQLCSQEELDRWKKSERILVTEPFTFIRDPLSGQTVSDAVAGSILERRDEQHGRVAVMLPDGREGILPGDHAVDIEKWRDTPLADASPVTGTALSMKGIPYLWGGTSIKGFDCSGYTKTVYFLNGIIIARDASLQARHGLEIRADKGWEEFEPGDLLFFRSSPDGAADSRVTHVAIYTGDSEYIHAAGMVTINSLDSTRSNYSPYRASTLQSARRIIGQNGSGGIVPVSLHRWFWPD